MNRLEIPFAPIAMGDRAPPYAPEAEISVLGGMLIDGDAVARAIEVVDDTMFYREANRRVFRAMVRLFMRGQVVDAVTLREELDKTDELDSVGGQPYIAELLDAVPTAANIQYHARIVRERALLRRLIEASSTIIRDSYEPGERSVEQILDEAEQLIFQVAQGHDREGFVYLKQLLFGAFERIEKLQAAKGALIGVPSGFYDLDEMTGGLQKGDLVVIAARPSMGKTALVVSMAAHAAVDNRTTVGLFTLEMSKDQIVYRMLCAEAFVDLQRLLRGRLQDDDYVRLAHAAARLNSAAVWIDDSGSLSILEMRAKARRLKAEQKDLGLIIIDYIQLMHSQSRVENRQQEVSAISRGLKALAKELDIPIIALSQLSRAPELRADKKPILSDLRESGSIEQDADIVMFLYRPEYYFGQVNEKGESIVGKAELIIAKQRNGPTGTVDLVFQKECARFDSLAHDRNVANLPNIDSLRAREPS